MVCSGGLVYLKSKSYIGSPLKDGCVLSLVGPCPLSPYVVKEHVSSNGTEQMLVPNPVGLHIGNRNPLRHTD